MAETQSILKKKGGTTPSRQGLYAAAAAHSLEAINTLVHLMKNSPNPNVKLGAAKALLDKALPDLKATEISGLDGGNIGVVVRVIEDIPSYAGNRAEDKKLPPAAGDIQPSGPVQDST